MDFCDLYSFNHEQQTCNKLFNSSTVGINISSLVAAIFPDSCINDGVQDGYQNKDIW